MDTWLSTSLCRRPTVIKLQEGEYIRLWIDIYKPDSGQPWDCDNLWPWTKWFRYFSRV